MKFQIASDLHLEFLEHLFPRERLIQPAADADALILAGDIARGTSAIELFSDWPVPVLYVAGNHEFYGHQIEDLRVRLHEASAGTCITFLDNSTKVFGSVRILGATLWTDYRLELNRTQRQLLEHADLRINDHRRIQTKDGQFSARHALAEHEVSRAWLARELEQIPAGKTVVVTHHGPHRLSIHPRYAGDALNAAFVSNLSELLPRADLWIHGHVHDTFDYTVGRCRVVANPIGYPRNLDSVEDVRGLVFENTGFQSACVVEV